MFWIFNFSVAVFNFFLKTILAIRVKHMIKKRYPGLKISKEHWTVRVTTLIKSIIMYICPIFNLLFCYVYLFKDDEVCEKTIAKVYQKSMEMEKTV